MVYMPIEQRQLAETRRETISKKELHDQTWNRTPIAYGIAVGIEPETVKQRTSRYNLKKGGEIWYIYPSRKGN